MTKNELVRLGQMEVLQPVAYLKWAAPIAVIGKANGSTRYAVAMVTCMRNGVRKIKVDAKFGSTAGTQRSKFTHGPRSRRARCHLATYATICSRASREVTSTGVCWRIEAYCNDGNARIPPVLANTLKTESIESLAEIADHVIENAEPPQIEEITYTSHLTSTRRFNYAAAHSIDAVVHGPDTLQESEDAEVEEIIFAGITAGTVLQHDS
ncbi:hypothetical protein ACTXT7_017423 [Hymenolepis weldensis]